jgi:hypothetical protein
MRTSQRRLLGVVVLVSQLLPACGAPLTDAQLAWCLDTTPNGTKEVVAYPEGLGGGGLGATFDRMQAWENSWRAEHPGEPLPTKTVPDETTSNAFAVTTAASNLGIDFVKEGFRPEPGENPSQGFVRACLAAYETR